MPPTARPGPAVGLGETSSTPRDVTATVLPPTGAPAPNRGEAAARALAERYRHEGRAFAEVGAIVDGAAMCARVARDLEALVEGLGDEYIGLAEAVRRSGLTAGHLRRMIRNGEIPNRGKGRLRQVAADALPSRRGAPEPGQG